MMRFNSITRARYIHRLGFTFEVHAFQLNWLLVDPNLDKKYFRTNYIGFGGLVVHGGGGVGNDVPIHGIEPIQIEGFKEVHFDGTRLALPIALMQGNRFLAGPGNGKIEDDRFQPKIIRHK